MRTIPGEREDSLSTPRFFLGPLYTQPVTPLPRRLSIKTLAQRVQQLSRTDRVVNRHRNTRSGLTNQGQRLFI